MSSESNSGLIGSTLGVYKVVEQLGAGGMATVFKGYQESMDRHVAIKVLPRHLANDPTFVGRFKQEAKVIANLEHARILPVYDYGEDDGTTYIVMRLLDAGTLEDKLDAGVDYQEALRVIRQVGEGLDYAHSKGVIHRDVKPANIMLDTSGDVYITDFGISKLVEGTQQFTGSGIVGTPAYVSPEQGLGQGIDHRSDVYSLGVVLYQMLIGDVPYHAETPMAVVIKHIYEPLPMPRSIKPDLPESLERVILKAMAKQPDDRFQTCRAFADALEQAMNAVESGDDEWYDGELPDAASYAATLVGAASGPSASGTQPGSTGYAPTIQAPVPPSEATQANQATQAAAASAGTPKWVLPLAIGGGLLGLAILAAIVVLLVTRPGPREGDQPPPTSEVNAADIDGIQCPQGQTTILTADLETDSRDGIIIPSAMEDRFQWTDETLAYIVPGDTVAAVYDLGDNTFTHGTARAIVSYNADSTPNVAMILHYNTSSEEGYRFTILQDGSAYIVQGGTDGDVLAEADVSDRVTADQAFMMEFVLVDGQLLAILDGEVLMSVSISEPLDDGNIALAVQDGRLDVYGIQVCAGDGDGEARTSIGFEDQFDGSSISGSWIFTNLPDNHGLQNGYLGVPVTEITTMLVTLPGEPTVEVDTNVLAFPESNGEGVGLIITNEAGDPLYALVRAYLEAEDGLSTYFMRFFDGEIVEIIPANNSLPDADYINLLLAIDGGYLEAWAGLADQSFGGSYELVFDIELTDADRANMTGAGLIFLPAAEDSSADTFFAEVEWFKINIEE